MPFQSDTPAKLEELITQGELKFSEIEWINVSERGTQNVSLLTNHYYNRNYNEEAYVSDIPPAAEEVCGDIFQEPQG